MGKYKVSWMERSFFRLHISFYFIKNCPSVHTLYRQGSFLVYPIDLEEEEDIGCQITKGIPTNTAIKVLVRVYIVKVSQFTSQTVVCSRIAKHLTALLSLCPAGHQSDSHRPER